MKEDREKKESYWVVEAQSPKGKVMFFGEYNNFEPAWEKYHSFKEKASVMLQRRFREIRKSA